MSQLAPRRTATTVVSAVIAVAVLAGIAWLTLAPQRIEDRHPAFVHAALLWVGETFGPLWGRIGTADIVANIAVFVPVGILAYLILPRRAWFVALLAGPVLSTAIEVCQALVLPERDASLHDIAAASIGSTLGVAVAALCTLVTARTSSH